ncbi:MAG: hypothetical protein KIH69_002220, partial [Anaerolineae bacterium]|nr:hypothetical protein [Anaerolineae bacterium]
NGNTATSGTDFTAVSNAALTIPAGQTVATATVSVVGDTLYEGNETFTVSLSSPVNATILVTDAVGTITDDDAIPQIFIGDASAAEGNAGTVNLTFNVTLSASSSVVVTAAYNTSAGTASTGSDFAATSGTVTFIAGETSKSITVSISGDTVYESNETLSVVLSNLTNASAGRTFGLGTITNDDTAPVIVINASGAVSEGNSGNANMVFTATLAGSTELEASASYATASGTALQGTDFLTAAGSITFSPGITQRIIVVQIIGDTAVEANETFILSLSAPINATLDAASATGMIINDDVSPSPPAPPAPSPSEPPAPPAAPPPDTTDTDGDGRSNTQDPDDDADGVVDQIELQDGYNLGLGSGGAPNVDVDGDGVINVLDPENDGDGIPDGLEGTSDTDGDGKPDYMDDDSDGDGISDLVEAGLITRFGSDGKPLDTDQDGLPDDIDAEPNRPSTKTIAVKLRDSDGDGVPDYLDLDSDNDGIPDVDEIGVGGLLRLSVDEAVQLKARDTDGDGVPDYLDIDSDNDCISDIVELGLGEFDKNNDGLVDGTDADKDGILDAVDSVPGKRTITKRVLPDTDNDGLPDHLDPDSNNDGKFDIAVCIAKFGQNLDANQDGRIDNATDADKDGVADVIDADKTKYGGIRNPLSGSHSAITTTVYLVFVSR